MAPVSLTPAAAGLWDPGTRTQSLCKNKQELQQHSLMYTAVEAETVAQRERMFTDIFMKMRTAVASGLVRSSVWKNRVCILPIPQASVPADPLAAP